MKSFLEARHQALTGDESLVFDEYANEMQKRALGFYDPKTDTINLNKLSEEVLNHELGHKLLRRLAADKQNGILDQVKREVGEDALKQQYGKDYGDDTNLLAEEWLADNYAKFAKARQNGLDVRVFGYEFNIPPRIASLFDKIYTAVQGLIGKQDLIKQFYTQIESGRLASPKASGRLEGSLAWKIKQDPAGNDYVEVDKNILEGTPKSQHLKAIRKFFQDQLQGKQFDLNYGEDGTAKINSQSTNKYIQPDSNLEARGRIAGELPDILKVSRKIGEASDRKGHSFAKDGFEYRQATVKIGDKYFDLRINVGLNGDNKTFYTINGIKESPLVQGEPRSRWELSTDTIPNKDGNVKFMVGGENATGYSDALASGRNFKGLEGKNRFEFDDSNANFKDNFKPLMQEVLRNRRMRKTTQGIILEHDELFKQYPDLKNMTVEVGKAINRWGARTVTLGEYLRESDKIILSREALRNALFTLDGASELKKIMHIK